MFASLGSTAAMNEGMSRGFFFNDFTVSLSCFLIEVSTVIFSFSVVSVILGGEAVTLDWKLLGWLIRAGFLPFLFACLEATETISLMFTFADMFTILKGLEMFSSPAMPVRYSSL